MIRAGRHSGCVTVSVRVNRKQNMYNSKQNKIMQSKSVPARVQCKGVCTYLLCYWFTLASWFPQSEHQSKRSVRASKQHVLVDIPSDVHKHPTLQFWLGAYALVFGHQGCSIAVGKLVTRTLSKFQSHALSVLCCNLILCPASSRDSVAIVNPTSRESPNAEKTVGLDFFCVPVSYHLPNPSTILEPHHDDYSLSETTLGYLSLTQNCQRSWSLSSVLGSHLRYA